jgi:tripartite motif-containing protein 71
MRIAKNRDSIPRSARHVVECLLAAFALLFANPAAAQTYALSGQLGSTGSGPGQFNAPGFVAIDPASHHIVVSDTGNSRVQIFDSLGNYLSQFGTAGTGNGQFAPATSGDPLTTTEQLPGPAGVAIDPASHNIVVVDGANARLQIFDSLGRYISQFRTAGHLNDSPLFTPGQNNATWFPADVAIDSDTHNIVAAVSNFYWDTDYFFACVRLTIDYGWVTTLGVQTFSPTGEYSSQFQNPDSYCNGQTGYTYPRTIAIDSRLRHIVVGNKSGDVEVFDYAGTALRQIAVPATAVAVDARNSNIVVLSENQIQIFTATGQFQQKFATGGGTGTHPNTGFSGMAVDPDNGNILVVDPSNNRVEIFSPASASSPTPVACLGVRYKILRCQR